jgi:hypothetical protein
MNFVIRQFVSKFARVGKEVKSMTIASKEAQLYRLRDLFWWACDWALKRLPAAILWIIARHFIHLMTGLSLTF